VRKGRGVVSRGGVGCSRPAPGCCAAWFGVAFTLGAAAGLRQGEATGLTLDRVDFLRRQLTVDRQLVTPAAGDPELGPPKTARSYRTVPLAGVALEELARHVEAHGTGQGGLLVHEGGQPVRRQRFGKVWRGLRARAAATVAAEVEEVDDADPARHLEHVRSVLARRGSTICATPTPARSCRAGCRWRPQRSTWATPPPCSCGPTPTSCRPTTTGPERWCKRPSLNLLRTR
jgi:hypothetical protein